ncbi:hypothetical protein LguiB_023196 [Lonicera macranthoides]
MGIGGDRYHKLTLGQLNPEDAQKPFDETVVVELLNSDVEISCLANSITRLCEGLPLTLVTVGQAMSIMKTRKAWKHAEGMLRDMAHQFKAKQLIEYWIRESFFNPTHLSTLYEIRNRGHHIINTLRAANLLENGEDNKVVSMHETIRASAQWIAAESGQGENKLWVCFWYILRNYLLIIGPRWKEYHLFEVSRRYYHIGQVAISKYVALLHIRVPQHFKKLTKLKILELNFINVLQMIPQNVIGSLLNLQLNMYSSGCENRIQEGSVLFGDGEALLEELQSLDYLEDLRITVTHAAAIQTLWDSAKSHLTHSLFITKCEESASLQIKEMENLEVLHVFECPDLVSLWLEGRFANLLHARMESCWALNLTWRKFAPTLQSLKLTSIYSSPLPFSYLEEIMVLYCPKKVKLPLNEENAKKRLKFIRGHKKWWEELTFGDNIDLKLRFEKYSILVKEDREQVPR